MRNWLRAWVSCIKCGHSEAHHYDAAKGPGPCLGTERSGPCDCAAFEAAPAPASPLANKSARELGRWLTEGIHSCDESDSTRHFLEECSEFGIPRIAITLSITRVGTGWNLQLCGRQCDGGELNVCVSFCPFCGARLGL